MEWTTQKDTLQHHGILGQKWGVRRYQNKDGTWTAAGKKRYQKEFEKDVKKNWTEAYNKAADRFNSEVTSVNEKYAGKNSEEETRAYIREVGDLWQKSYKDALIDRFGKSPIDDGEDWVKNAPFMNQYAEIEDDYVREFTGKRQ